MIPYGRQDISDEDVEAVTAVLRSDFLTQGPAVPRFEAAIREATGAAHAIAVNSATSALHIACMALDLGPGDWLWTVPNTFVASANVGLYCGADVDFVDIDPETYVMCPKALEAKLDRAEAAGRLPKIVIPVHFAGQSADMAAIGALAARYGFKVIEDASHAIGASYRDRPVGDCAHSDICVFSFHPVKIITTAEGGCATTNDAGLASRMELHRSHGVTRETALMEGASEGGWYYEQVALGYNYRMTELQAALGASQMTRLSEFVAKRHEIARRYDRLLGNMALTLPRQSPDSHSALHLYPIQVEDRARVFARLREAGIGVNVHYIPVHTQPFWRKRGFARGDFPVAEAYYERAISLPLYPGLTEADQDRVVAALAGALDG
ncbi:UDP-4-amino-4,6-dideoxy-N-acetyl-beta-L-altrosamine transaminase [Defluviimonas sp. WL0050]|uniref:UDP-4-amino-4, 6-dideoxy-N-acetyl-beta-L-altrosamine transaminase n=1 Tax=Albidovulum litorale TaxID=2984134 RepID=A0ABT2ZMS8_9RHOB|nr:UDP-4-amino-4,6-dideoxy-N-acetyl-beta-L-altrosamine transaminase [Defluviimonas sp. WL0050]MCV2872377.1 UDP-4-amino-4,6-dideoxy-N-acetyl-beta-L-altrosamine transaminase [Defluviimonas sp. WL0050]